MGGGGRRTEGGRKKERKREREREGEKLHRTSYFFKFSFTLIHTVVNSIYIYITVKSNGLYVMIPKNGEPLVWPLEWEIFIMCYDSEGINLTISNNIRSVQHIFVVCLLSDWYWKIPALVWLKIKYIVL